MLRIPPIAPLKLGRKRRLLPLQRCVGRAHYRLPQVVKAVRQVPRALHGQLVELVRLVRGDDADDGVQAVQLVRDGGCEGAVGVLLERGGEVVVGLGVVDLDVAEAAWVGGLHALVLGLRLGDGVGRRTWDDAQPFLVDGVSEEGGAVLGNEFGVWGESFDLLGDCSKEV